MLSDGVPSEGGNERKKPAKNSTWHEASKIRIHLVKLSGSRGRIGCVLMLNVCRGLYLKYTLLDVKKRGKESTSYKWRLSCDISPWFVIVNTKSRRVLFANIRYCRWPNLLRSKYKHLTIVGTKRIKWQTHPIETPGIYIHCPISIRNAKQMSQRKMVSTYARTKAVIRNRSKIRKPNYQYIGKVHFIDGNEVCW